MEGSSSLISREVLIFSIVGQTAGSVGTVSHEFSGIFEWGKQVDQSLHQFLIIKGVEIPGAGIFQFYI